MTDEARAVAEVAIATAEIARTARGAGGYLAAVFGSVPHDLVGVLGGDWLHETRRRNVAQLQANTDRLLEGIAAERRIEISGSVFLPLIEACVDEGRPELQALWAALLANAMVDGGRKVRRDFFDAVKRMEPADAFIFNTAGDFAPTNVNGPGALRQHIAEKARQVSMSDIDVQVSVDALIALRCFEIDYLTQPRIAPFGKALLAVCRPPS